MDTKNLDNAPVLVAELDRLHADASGAGIDGEIAVWKAATRLGVWFFINRGTDDAVVPYAVQPPGMAPVVCVYSCRERAAAAASALGQGENVVFGLLTPKALEYALALGERGAGGIVLDHPRIGLWTPMANVPRFGAWLVPQSAIRRVSEDEA